MLAVLMALLLGGDPDFAGAFRSGVRLQAAEAAQNPEDIAKQSEPEGKPFETKAVEAAKPPVEPPKEFASSEADTETEPPERPKQKPMMGLSSKLMTSNWGSSLSRAVRFDPEPPPELMKAAPKRKVALIVPENDPNCWVRPGVMTDRAKRFSTHPLLDIVVLKQNYRACKSVPAIYDPKSDTFFCDACLESWDVMIDEINDELDLQKKRAYLIEQPAGAARAGGIKREWLEAAAMVFRYFPEFTGRAQNQDAFSHADGLYLFAIPANLGISWTTENGATTIKLAGENGELIKASVNVLKTTCPSIVVRAESLTICLDWAPDLVLEGE